MMKENQIVRVHHLELWQQVALKYLKDTEVNIDNIFIIIGGFNIRDSS